MAVTLIVEDGTGITGSNTYIDVDDAVTYSTNWENTAFTAATSDEQAQALYAAAYSLDRLYGRRYISVLPPASGQGLLWPRYTIMGNDFRKITQGTIPTCLLDAQCELANLYLSGTNLFPNETDNRLFKETTTAIAVIKEANTYWKIPTDVERYDGFRKVELILFPILVQENNDGARWSL